MSLQGRDMGADLMPQPLWRLAIAMAALFAVSALPLTATPAAPGAGFLLAAFGLGLVLVAASAIDLASLRLPDALTLPLIPAGILLAFTEGPEPALMHAIAAVAAGLALWAVAALYRGWRGFDGLGLGDVKLFAAAGAWVGLEGLASVLLAACGLALAWVGVRRLAGEALSARSAVPFGPALGWGLWVVWLYGPLA